MGYNTFPRNKGEIETLDKNGITINRWFVVMRATVGCGKYLVS